MGNNISACNILFLKSYKLNKGTKVPFGINGCRVQSWVLSVFLNFSIIKNDLHFL